jgi:tetratricopeptide (TPR) repeat protein
MSHKILSTNYGYLGDFFSYLSLKQENKSDFDSAIFYYQKALDLAKSLNNKDKISQNLQGLAITYLDAGFYEEALDYFQQAHVYLLQFGDSLFIADNIMNMGIVEYEQGNISAALGMYLKAYSYYQTQKGIKYPLSLNTTWPMPMLSWGSLKKHWTILLKHPT